MVITLLGQQYNVGEKSTVILENATLDPGAWYNIVQEGGRRFMAAWVREEENASN